MGESELYLKEEGGLLSLHQCLAGNELNFISRQKPSSSNNIFKALGDIDIVVFEDTQNTLIDEARKLDPDLINSRYLKLLKWQGRYNSPNLKGWFDNAKIGGLICLNIDKWLYQPATPEKKLQKTINSMLEKIKDSSEKIAIYSGLSHIDFFVLVKCQSFQELVGISADLQSITVKDVFPKSDFLGLFPDELLELKEELDFPLFSSTVTIPLISYREIVEKKNYNALTEKLRAHIKISSPQIDISTSIDNFISKIDARKLFVFNNNNLLLDLSSNVAIGNIVSELFKFRDYGNSVVKTETVLLFDESLVKAPSHTYTINYDDSVFKDFEDILDELEKSNFHIAASVRNFMRTYAALYRVKDNYPAIKKMDGISARLVGECADYLTLKDNKETTFDLLSFSNTVISHSYLALSQRLEIGLGINNSRITGSNYDGFLSSVLAVENMLTFIYKTWFDKAQSLSIQEKDWVGFVFFSDLWGYSLRPAQVYSMPEESAYKPFGEDMNWLTITHEVSHDIFNHLNMHEYIVEHINYSLTRSGIDNDIPDFQNTSYYEAVLNMYWELFANWFDFYHFYNEDYDFFHKNIWNCWLKVPSVGKGLKIYIVRSFLVSLMNDTDKLFEAYLQDNDEEYIYKQFDIYKEYLIYNFSFFSNYKFEKNRNLR